ncbi:MAG: membrane protein insertase YidC [Puniceicoccales bacterium]|nr:membrane protein insertase YidC [Puniceicoccales bacterium]
MPSSRAISVLLAMDRKSFFLGLLCLLGAFALMYCQRTQVPPSVLDPEITMTQITTHPESLSTPSDTTTFFDTSPSATYASWDLSTPCVTLENEEICVKVHIQSAAIKEVMLKKYPFKKDRAEPFIFNYNAKIPALDLQLGDMSEKPHYELVTHEAQRLHFIGRYANGLTIEREYRLSNPDNPKEDPYVIHHRLCWENHGQQPYPLQDVKLSLGSIPSAASDTTGDFLNFGYFNGKKTFFVKHSEFASSSGFFGLGQRSTRSTIQASDSIRWGSVKNQFFTSILTPHIAASGYMARPTESLAKDQTTETLEGMTGALSFQLGWLQVREQKTLDTEFYVGPKDFVRLDRLGLEQDRVMQFGFFGFVSKILFLLMKAIHYLIPNWGLTIIAVTILIRLLLWPLTRAQVRSSQQMALIQGPLKQIREKYNDQPQKLQAETLKLFKEHQVNPAAGCLPIFVQIPIFLGLYSMLRTVVDLRFAEFLWIRDLSMPDTVAHIGSFSINILPWLMGITTFWQMRMTLSPGLDPIQRRIFQWMPWLFLFFCYNLPSGLILYWTVQNVLSIVQQRHLAKKAPVSPKILPHESMKKTKKSSSRPS